MEYAIPFIIAIVLLVIGYTYEGSSITSQERFYTALKWVGIGIIAIYILLVVAALSDGLGDIPLLGGGAYWVRGHWRRY